MKTSQMRRQILKGGLAAAGLGMVSVPDWMLPVLAQGETLVPFTDLPANFNANPAPDRRFSSPASASPWRKPSPALSSA